MPRCQLLHRGQNVTQFLHTVQHHIDRKTKPVGSLGRVEALAAQIAAIQKSLTPSAKTCQLILFAGDHGLANAGLSAYPQAVTRQMVLNFLAGGAASNVFAKSVGVDVRVVDTGVAGDPVDHPDLLDMRIAGGTANAIEGPAMTADQLSRALSNGQRLGQGIDRDAVCFGEMGIANTASSSLIAAKILGVPVPTLTGRGTGLDDAGLARKMRRLEVAAQRTVDTLDAKGALMEYGGFEIATMVGAIMGAASVRRIILVDGFIASVAALCARELQPGCEHCFIFAHRSAEAGHDHVLEALQATPLLDLDMRLGEGTGALLAWPLVKAAAAMLSDMASFDSAGISGPA